MYNAIVARVSNISPIQGADRIQIAEVLGHRVIVGKDVQVGDTGILYPPDGCFTHEHAHHNNLYRKGKGENADPTKTGYLDENRRIRTIKMKGERSEGIFMPTSSIAWTGFDPAQLTIGQQFDTLAGRKVCEKYYTRATREKQKTAFTGGKKARRQIQLAEHYDTPQLRYNIHRIPDGATLHFTEKLHGTSGRTGHVLAGTRLNRFQLWWNWLAAFLGLPLFATQEYVYCSGTRRVNLDPDFSVDKGFYDGTQFRNVIHNVIKAQGLYKGETLYYEIVGYDEKGRPIMPSHTLDPKDQADQIQHYGTDKMQYAYGCTPTDFSKDPDLAYDLNFRVFVYRITVQDEDGEAIDLPWSQVKARCGQLGLRHVPELTTSRFFSSELAKLDPDGLLPVEDCWVLDENALQRLTYQLADGPSTLDPTHIREGECTLVESDRMWTALKRKGWQFSTCEGIRKDDSGYVDPEEIA